MPTVGPTFRSGVHVFSEANRAAPASNIHMFVSAARLVVPLLLTFAVVAQAAPQQPAAAAQSPGALKVFLDCNSCDEDFLRTEITFIDYMRDRTDADVHVLVTTQSTGGGGTEYTLKFIGLGRFAGVEQTLKHNQPQTATQDERRKGLAATLKLGLVRYVAETPLAPKLKVSYEGGADKGQTTAKRDPWNLWVYQTNVGGSFNGEESTSSHSLRGSVSAQRTTDAWKLAFESNYNYRESRFDLGDGTTFRTVTRNVNQDALVVKSLTKHWSAAVVESLGSSTFVNYDLRFRIAPGIEYDIFPYSESTRRLFTVQYTVGYDAFDYHEETIFGKTSEQLADHRLQTSFSMRQPWGSAFSSVNFSQYLSQPDKYSISAFGETNVRLFKGFSFNVFGEVARTKDQIYLPRGEATTEEILVQQRQLATGYRYFLNFGISYSFGSIYNNVVNPRFGNNCC